MLLSFLLAILLAILIRSNINMDYLDIEKIMLIIFCILIIMSGIGLAILSMLYLEYNSFAHALNASRMDTLDIENYYTAIIPSRFNISG